MRLLLERDGIAVAEAHAGELELVLGVPAAGTVIETVFGGERVVATVSLVRFVDGENGWEAVVHLTAIAGAKPWEAK